MSGPFLFEFSVSKEKKTIYITREFDAPLEMVWDAWTIPAYLDQWFGPKPYQAKTLFMDFREGGYWHYALISEEYDHQWGRTDYHRIVKREYFTASDSFLNENQILIAEYPVSNWKIEFKETENRTVIHVTTTY